jgi:hypothetical protein
MDVRYLVLSLFFLVSCMPTANVSKGNLSTTETTGGTTSGGNTNIPRTSLSWNYLGQLASLITVNVSNLNNSYIVGSPVETFLAESENFTDANYCLISSFSIGGLNYELRTRGVPVSYYDFKLKRVVKVLRIDFQDKANSLSYCNKTVKILNPIGDYVTDTTTPPAARINFEPGTICPLCTSMITASRIRLFQVVGTNINQISSTKIDSSLLTLQVDPNYSSVGEVGSCSNSTCRARGFDCCLENQCIKDGSEKPSARTTYASLFATAEAQRLQNPLAYLNYPQLYYICGTSVPTTGGSAGGSTGGTSSGSSSGDDASFIQLKKDYQCVEHIKAQASSSPFHGELLNRSYTATTDCLTAPTDSQQTFYYQNVIKRLYSTCGCNRTNLQEMITNCPAYEYTVTTRDSQGQPIRIDCYTPPGDINQIPREQQVSVNSRSVPHRFFDQSGVEKNPQIANQQEGSKFEYTDESFVLPVQTDFSMNAILGQMSVTLDKALPAKEVQVEYDQIYFISTTSGFYTPCPQCAKDSWLNAFTAFPSSSTGTGLQAVGYTTERDSFSTNLTAGNYEDTIFGRACWIPPTMIPYSHAVKTTVQDQRLTRLEAQSAFFVNGYQRDWYGFNKGALIGSFDGVTWFAIGKGRIVRSSSKKLYLAINAPFADVASPTSHVVRVAAYDGLTQAAQFDYDPEYHQTHSYQNEAGNCQRYHMCSTDTDCITKLGWEYACGDVKDLKTNWPSFDVDAKEQANTSLSLTFDQILQQKRFPSSSTKRCVYRGAGALCHSDVARISSTELNKRKLLTCAPNFFCANVGSTGVHNTKISRFAAPLEEIPVSRNHLFGRDANILGRPENYVGFGSLASSIRSTIISNVTQIDSSMSAYTGLCQPGKALPSQTNEVALSNPFTQHGSADTNPRRTDYIGQIGSCNSGLFTLNRHSSCPVIGSDGNYEMFATGTIQSGYAARATTQNACGLESLLPTANLSSSPDTLTSSSPFRSIEAKPLSSQVVVDMTFARDACFRRAGSVCHTDLDCSPNKIHAAQVDFFSKTFFGNIPEKTYWSEDLVCGQTDPKPMPSNTDTYRNYDMSKNRCCREVGKDLTTYTADIPTKTAGGYYDSETTGLLMTTSTALNANNPKRYSRLATVENIGVSSLRPALSAYQERTMAQTLAANPAFALGTNVKSPYQWRSLTEANQESCCGGGWIRKFSDGTNDWTRKDRLVLDVTNFRCLNSRTPLITSPEDLISAYGATTADVTSLLSQDYGDYCKDNTNTKGACAQFSILDSTMDVLPDTAASGIPYSSTVTVNTIKPSYNATSNGDNYFLPRSADSDSAVIIDLNSTNTTARKNIAIRVPSFVTRSDFDGPGFTSSKTIRLEDSDGNGLDCSYDAAEPEPTLPTTPLSSSICGPLGVGCCYYKYFTTTRILKVWLNTAAAGSASFDKKKIGVVFTTKSAGNVLGLTRSKPGSTAYYLRRLGLLELSGVPQITFEALTCNDNTSRILPGIFKPTIKTVSDFSNSSFSFLHSYPAQDKDGNTITASGRMFTNMLGLNHEPVFSSNDFKCCTPLGKTVSDTTKCCSGFGIPLGNNGTQFTCGLPSGTNLMVYFNRFVSNEGRGTDQPGGGLLDGDFHDSTGEPFITSTVNDKIRALGEAYCETGKVRQGGAFGAFEPEPQGSETDLTSKIYNMVDSPRDIGQNSNAGATAVTGYPAFIEGFRWNHHLYCDYSE